jgi:multidrug resistance protein
MGQAEIISSGPSDASSGSVTAVGVGDFGDSPKVVTDDLFFIKDPSLPQKGTTNDHGGLRDVETLSQVSAGPLYSAFPRSTKLWITFMVTVASFISPMTACIYFPILPALAESMGVSIGLINLTITSYMVCQGLLPMLFGEFGDVAGRRPAYILAFSIYFCANIGLALQNNYAALLVLRCLQSAGVSGTIALGFASVADISSSAERGRYMGIVGAGINIGPTLGPVLGGVLTQFLGWRAIFWFCVILTGAWLIPYVLCVPETCRNVVGNGSIPPQGWSMTLIDFVRFRRSKARPTSVAKRKLRFPNPLNTLRVVLDKEMALILFYNSLLYVVFVDVAATLSTQFKAIYHFNDLQIGLCYLPYGFGCCVANLAQGYVLDWNYARIARKIGFAISRKRGDDISKFPIEKARIQPIYPILSVGLLVLTGYGWALQAQTSLAVPLVLQFLIGICIPGPFSIMNTLIVDLYPDAPATATAANNLIRCSMAAGGTAAIESMITGMGQGWCFTFMALVCGALMPTLWVLERHGPRWREQRARTTAVARQEKQNRAST